MSTPEPMDPIDECVRLSRELARLNEDYNGMLEEAVAVEKERNALKAELAALREDKARLDWLENPETCYGVCIERQPDEFSIICTSRLCQGVVRAAIDAAMKGNHVE